MQGGSLLYALRNLPGSSLQNSEQSLCARQHFCYEKQSLEGKITVFCGKTDFSGEGELKWQL